MERMTETRIRKQTKPGIFRIDTTLYIRVFPGGSKSFVQKLVLKNGRRIELGLGGWPLRTFDEAREIAFQNRRVARDGGNPLALKRAATEKTNVPTFRQCAEKWFSENEAGWDPMSSKRIWARLAAYAFDGIGDRPVDAIDQSDILKILVPIFAQKFETGKQLRQRIGGIMKWSMSHGYRADNPAGDVIAAALPKASKTKHHTAIKASELVEALDAIDATAAYDGAKLAIRFIALTAVRSNEALRATWDEFNLVARTWTIPGGRMKMNVAHRVPLSDAALAVLREARKLSDGNLVFPRRRGGYVDDRQLRRTVEVAGLNNRMSIHGLRSTFRDWCADSAQPRDIAEASLAHSVAGVEGAYFRSDVFDRRRELMAAWDRYLHPTSAKVVAIRG